MQIPRQPYRRAAVAVLSALLTCLGLSAIGSRSIPARAASIGQLQNQISAGQGAVSSLAGQVGAANAKVGQLGASIANTEAQIKRIQADLWAKRAELFKLRTELNQAQTRLTQLENQAQYDDQVLARQLVGTYESDPPDLMTVVLESKGFQDLLETISFQQRIHKQNVSVIQNVRAARRAEAAAAIRLGALEVRQQNLTQQVLLERNRLDATNVALIQEQLSAIHVRDAKAGQLASARDRVSNLRHQLNQALAIQAYQQALARRQAQQAAQSSAPAGSGSSGQTFAPSAAPSSGGFTFPLPKGSVGGPGTWSPDDGVDMAAPGDTPEYAVCSGTIVLHGIGGFGPWAPVLHCDSAVGGYSYVYYGHAGPLYQLAVGTHVSAGQVISSIGPGIVGISTGPHIEIGFCDSSGTPLGPGTAGTMMSLLQGAYG